MRNGSIPYRDIFDHKGPMIYFIDAWGDSLCGFRGVGFLEIIFWIGFLLILHKIWNVLNIDVLYFGLLAAILPFLLQSYLCGGNMTEEYALPFIAYGNLYLLNLCTKKKVNFAESFFLSISASAVLCLKPNMTAVFFC